MEKAGRRGLLENVLKKQESKACFNIVGRSEKIGPVRKRKKPGAAL